jgi:hypothetical protein
VENEKTMVAPVYEVAIRDPECRFWLSTRCYQGRRQALRAARKASRAGKAAKVRYLGMWYW